MDFEDDIKALAGGGLDEEAQAKIVERLFWGDNPAPEDGLVPSVSAVDLKAVWKMWRDMPTPMSGQQVAVDRSIYQSVCSLNANVPAVQYRASMLLLSQLDELPDAVQQPIVELPDAVFELAAKFPMKRMAVGVPQRGLPFDVEEFAKQVEEAVRHEQPAAENEC
jgi:hypothetical protein